MCVVCLCSSKETTEAAGPGFPGSCELPNIGPGNQTPEEQQILLSAEPSPPITKNLFKKQLQPTGVEKHVRTQKLARDFLAAARRSKEGTIQFPSVGEWINTLSYRHKME